MTSNPDLLDFDELDAIIHEEQSRAAAKKAAGKKQQKITGKRVPLLERFKLAAEIAAYEDRFVWSAIASVALFEVQNCSSCGHTQRFFRGWMTEWRHRSDPFARRLSAGKPDSLLPHRIEEHDRGQVEMCGDCAESVLLVEQIIAAACGPVVLPTSVAHKEQPSAPTA